MDNPLQNPYVGPRSFEEKDRQVFFGREEESRQLTALIIAHRVVVFYAPSGTGKTSLLNASVVPDLRRAKKIAVLPVSRAGGNLPPGLLDTEVGNIFVFNTLLNLGVEADLARLNLVEGLRSLLQAQEDELRMRPRLLILDQFEELFAQHPYRYDDKAGFFQQMSRTLEVYPHLSLLLSMREDYIAHLDPYAGQMPDRLRTRFRMERLNEAGALAAVEKPAALAGRTFEPGVAKSLVDNLRRIQLGSAPREQGDGVSPLGNFVEPVHLQIVCQQLWAGLPSGNSPIRGQDVHDFGDVDEALSGFYNGILTTVSSQTGVSERYLRNWFEQNLITPAHTRGLVFKGNEETEGLPQSAVQGLYEAYLIRTEVRSGSIWYELAHDRLVEPILASNAAWQRAHLQPFQLQAEAWAKSGKPASLLLRTEVLQQADTWADGHTKALLPTEKEFLEQSHQASELRRLELETRSAKHLRRIGRMAMAETITFILATVLFGFFIFYGVLSNSPGGGSPWLSALGILGLFCGPFLFLGGIILGIRILLMTFRLSRMERLPQDKKPGKPSPTGPSAKADPE